MKCTPDPDDPTYCLECKRHTLKCTGIDQFSRHCPKQQSTNSSITEEPDTSIVAELAILKEKVSKLESREALRGAEATFSSSMGNPCSGENLLKYCPGVFRSNPLVSYLMALLPDKTITRHLSARS